MGTGTGMAAGMVERFEFFPILAGCSMFDFPFSMPRLDDSFLFKCRVGLRLIGLDCLSNTETVLVLFQFRQCNVSTTSSRLLVLEHRRTLFRKRRHALLLVLGRKRRVEQPPLKLETLAQRHFVRLVHGLLDHNRNRGRHGSNLLGELDSLFEGFFGGEDLRDETGTLGFLGREKVAGKAEFHGLGFSNGLGQALGTTGTGDRAELNLGLAKLGVGTGVDDVAHHGELAAAAERKAVDGSDDRLADAGHVTPRRKEVVLVVRDVVAVLHFLDVRSGCMVAPRWAAVD